MIPAVDPGSKPKPGEHHAFEVGHDDKIRGFYEARDQRQDWNSSQERAQLELQSVKPKAGTLLTDLPRTPLHPATGRRKAVAVAVIIGGLLLPIAAIEGHRLWTAYQNRKTRASGLLVIDSVPSGARVFIEGKEVGTTPYVAPNTFPPETSVPARITYPGAEDWTGTFPGGVPATFTAELHAKAEQP